MRKRICFLKTATLILCAFIMINFIPVRISVSDYIEATYYDIFQKQEVTRLAHKLSDYNDGILESD